MIDWAARGVPRTKLVMGIATFGRPFKMSSPTKYNVGDPSLGTGAASDYSDEPAVLPYYEVNMCFRIVIRR